MMMMMYDGRQCGNHNEHLRRSKLDIDLISNNNNYDLLNMEAEADLKYPSRACTQTLQTLPPELFREDQNMPYQRTHL